MKTENTDFLQSVRLIYSSSRNMHSRKKTRLDPQSTFLKKTMDIKRNHYNVLRYCFGCSIVRKYTLKFDIELFK